MMIHLSYEGASMDVDTHGAELRAYRDASGKDRLWSGDAAVWKGVAPILFPSIGFLKDGVATIDGKPYPIPKHGFARDCDFTVSGQGGDHVTLLLTQNEETKKVYPFDFALLVTHRFVKGGFETLLTVENHSSRVMPFVLGGHPAFACPMAEGERFEDYVVRFEKPEEGRTLLCSPQHLMDGSELVPLGADGRTLALRYAEFDKRDTYVFAGLESRSVELVNPATGKGLRFSFPGMEVLALWTMPGANAPYLCIEPWQGLPDVADASGRFEDKPYHVALGAGGVYCRSYRMQLI